MAYRPSYKQIPHFMGRETGYCNLDCFNGPRLAEPQAAQVGTMEQSNCNLNSWMVEGVGCPVLAAR